MIRAALIWLLLCGGAVAQSMPTLHDVSDVAADDMLKVRSSPTTEAEIIGTLAPDATGIEVMDKRDGWGLVNVAGGSGWASLRYLPEVAAPSLPLLCHGAEPFWLLRIGSVGATLDRLGQPLLSYDTHTRIPSDSRPAQYGLDMTGNGKLHAIYSARLCSDGMSDQAFGVGIDMIVTPGEGPQAVYSGCCQMTEPRN